ncbi:hypothetical protein CMK17_21510, partial [Candidatus Poribacteria bacterium]|nr:hypothetical protein [Candidatus Poribacteria bacterium]
EGRASLAEGRASLAEGRASLAEGRASLAEGASSPAKPEAGGRTEIIRSASPSRGFMAKRGVREF